MTCVVISACNVASYAQGGGHFWVYMQYAQGLRRLGVDVLWLEKISQVGDGHADEGGLETFYQRMDQYGLGGKTILYVSDQSTEETRYEFLNVSYSEARRLLRGADLLLNFQYDMNPSLLEWFARTALVDIDPGLLQFWISTGQLSVRPHDVYFTIGETVGTAAARFSDCGLSWMHISPPICLDLWPYSFDPDCRAFTTVSHWLTRDWIRDESGLWENTKRVSFMEFLRLPQLTNQQLELALNLEKADEDRRNLERNGWRVRDASQVVGSPEKYQSYIRGSRGEFSCAKPSCMRFENAWVSDRSICYMASGKPVVVQNTGPSSYLPNNEGLYRFTTMEEALAAFEAINSDYERNCRAAREIAESLFDSRPILEGLLNTALEKGVEPPSSGC
ncbi:MAG TPA: hypothetical protein VEK15_16400 [Vicinamibacteria bacterium]|nr:hypothetical protein [Vicinamibacteria bacterium]